MFVALFAGLALASEPSIPSVDLTWHDDLGLLYLRAPEGEHVAVEAPLEVSLLVGERSVTVDALGTDLSGGLPVGEVRGLYLEGTVGLSLCEDGGRLCRRVDVAIEGTVSKRRKGAMPLAVRTADEPELPEQPPWRADAALVVEAAVEQAQAEGRPLLYDFGAVWCPPCHLLDAEVLGVRPIAEALAPYVVARIDVDDPSSFSVKHRLGVGSYPTMVATTADGQELGRLVGYPGRDATLAWMGGLGDAAPGDDVAEAAWRAVREERLDDARVLLAQADSAPDSVPFRLARMNLDPNAEDARWLADRAPGEALRWVGSTRSIASDPEVAAAVRDAAEADLTDATPLEAADLLYVVADMEEDDAHAARLFAAAAALVRGELSGEALRDKGHLGWLALLLDRAGRHEAAMDVLDGGRRAFPEEPTFHVAAARAHLEHGDGEEALRAAEAALAVGWGDNLLTSALIKARALISLDRREEALAFVEGVLAEHPPAPDGLDVRTGRYLDALRALRDPNP